MVINYDLCECMIFKIQKNSFVLIGAIVCNNGLFLGLKKGLNNIIGAILLKKGNSNFMWP